MKNEYLQRLLGLAVESNERKDEEIEEMHMKLLSSNCSVCLGEAVEAMDGLEKEVVESATNFSSRFMPNVKFRGNRETEEFLANCEAVNYAVAKKGWIDGWCISHDGKCILSLTEDVYFQQTQMKEVSIYEAIPELVPDGMVYDKESDSLVNIRKLTEDEMIKVMTTPFPSQPIKDPEQLEALLSKASHREGKVSLCESCADKTTCSTVKELRKHSAISECTMYRGDVKSPSVEDVELGRLLGKLQMLLLGEELPVLFGVKIESEKDQLSPYKVNYTLSFTTVDFSKKS